MASELERAIAAALARGRAAWPQLHVADDTFAAAVRAAVGDAADPLAAVGELAIDDLYLAQACVAGAAAAIAAFDQRCRGTLLGALRQIGLAPDAVDEVMHELHAKLFVGDGAPRIATYSGRAALPSWARTIATRAAVDRVRRQPPPSDDDMLDAVPDVADGPELAHFRRTYHAELKAAFEEALASLEVRERNLLRHHFVDQLTHDEIGALYGVHKTTAFRWLEAARIALAKRTRAGFQRRVPMLPDDVDSVLRLLQSHIDLSLSRVLAAP